jgi:hypothetical protein
MKLGRVLVGSLDKLSAKFGYLTTIIIKLWTLAEIF